MKGIIKTKEGKFLARYFAGYRSDGKRNYPSKTFVDFQEAVEWHRARKVDRDPEPLTVNRYPDGWLVRSYRSTRAQAAARNITFELTFEEYEGLFNRAEGKCSLTGIKFNFGPVRHPNARRPFAPSLDRASSRLGYTVSNCRVVCCAVNIALGDWGLDTLMLIAHNLVRRERELTKLARQESEDSERHTSEIRLVS